MSTQVVRRRYKDIPPIDRLDTGFIVPAAVSASLRDEKFSPFHKGFEINLAGAILPLMGSLTRRLGFERIMKMFRVNEDEALEWNSRLVSQYLTSAYPQRKYKAVIIAPPVGAAACFSVLFNAPLLPTSYCFPIAKSRPIDPEDVKENMNYAQKLANRFLRDDDNIDVIAEHDPVHNRLRVRHTALLRFRFIRMPRAYENFLQSCLDPDGVIITIEPRIGWRQYKGMEHFYFQVGSYGGIQDEEYQAGSKRIDRFLQKYLKEGKFNYRLALPQEVLPESLFGLTHTMKDSARNIAELLRKNYLHINYDEVHTLSRLTAELFIRASRREGKRPHAVLFHSGILVHTAPSFYSTLLPVWLPDSSFSSWNFAREIIQSYQFPITTILVALEPSIADAPDVFQLKRWKEIASGKAKVAFVATRKAAFPYDLNTCLMFWDALSAWSRRNHYPLDMRLEIKDLLEELDRLGIRFSMEKCGEELLGSV
ncbi:MAG: hypothetical protein AB1546_09295 [bacterium]